MDGEAVAGRLTNTCEAEQKGQRAALERSLTKHEERIEVLEKMVLRLYEDCLLYTSGGYRGLERPEVRRDLAAGLGGYR